MKYYNKIFNRFYMQNQSKTISIKVNTSMTLELLQEKPDIKCIDK